MSGSSLATSPTPIAIDFTGFYFGGHSGWADAVADAEFTNSLRPLKFSGESYLIGAFAGYGRQFGHFVLGVEADAERVNIEDFDISPPPPGLRIEGTFDLNWQGSVRARAGVTFDRFLIYATGGAAWAEADISGGLVFGLPTEFTDTQWGWTVGGGIEAQLGPRTFARVEYRYTDFEPFGGSLEPNLATNETLDVTMHSVRGAVGYRF